MTSSFTEARLGISSRKARAKLGDGHTLPNRMHHRTFVRLGREYRKIRHEPSEARHERILRTLETMEQERIEFDL